jgi:DNA-binding response OmpR family regulator
VKNPDNGLQHNAKHRVVTSVRYAVGRCSVRLLFAEDDVLLGRATCVALLQAGHAVDWVTTGNQVLASINKQDYDCVLLDLGLPGLSGEECLRSLRARKQHVPVVVLTARGQKDDRIAMLDLGADDYMVKPYDLDEMAARVRAVVRRSRDAEQRTEFIHGPLHLRSLTRAVTWYGEPVALTSKEFLLLDSLTRWPTRIVTREHLEQALYGWGEEIGSNAVEVHVHHLRRKLSPKLIVTVRGVGYRLGTIEQLNGGDERKRTPSR